MFEVKQYRCIKGCWFDAYDDDGFPVENQGKYIETGSIWQESKYLITGGPNNTHLDRVDCEPGTAEWCEPLRETLAECFEQIESIFY